MRKRTHRIPRFEEPGGPDDATLSQLRRIDSAASKPHLIHFYLYFPAQQNAENAKAELISSGFDVDLEESGMDSRWLCLAYKELVPRLKELLAIRNTLSSLASKFDGEYDGWETEVADPDPDAIAHYDKHRR